MVGGGGAVVIGAFVVAGVVDVGALVVVVGAVVVGASVVVGAADVVVAAVDSGTVVVAGLSVVAGAVSSSPNEQALTRSAAPTAADRMRRVGDGIRTVCPKSRPLWDGDMSPAWGDRREHRQRRPLRHPTVGSLQHPTQHTSGRVIFGNGSFLAVTCDTRPVRAASSDPPGRTRVRCG